MTHLQKWTPPSRQSSPPPKPIKIIDLGGGGRGTESTLGTIKYINENSERILLVPRVSDPAIRKAHNLTQKIRAEGVYALDGMEIRIEDFLPISGDSIGVFHLDNPKSIAKALRASAKTDKPVLAYLFMLLSHGQLVGIRCVCQAHENELKLQMAEFFECLATLTVRSGSNKVIGSEARPEHKILEPRFRNWFEKHFTSCLGKITAGIEPEHAPIEITMDGNRTSTLLLQKNSDGWGDPETLARTVLENPLTPIFRGQSFLLAEYGSEKDGIRLHEMRFRKTDGNISFHGTSILNKAKLEAEERERQQKLLEDALRKAERRTLTRTTPVFTTD